MNLFRCLRSRVFKRTMTGLPRTTPTRDEYELQRVLLVSKTTRLEFEHQNNPQLNESELRSFLLNNGSGHVLKSHDEHKKFEQDVIEELERLEVDVKKVDRYERPVDLIDWADTIISIGGDGTYLMSANKILDRSKPVIGLNSCPDTSTGYLCLPKTCSRDVVKTLRDIKKRNFTWAYRTRIRVTLVGKNIEKTWKSVHEPPCTSNVMRLDDNAEHFVKDGEEETYVLPHLALNEVYISESVPASVSYMDIAVDDGEFVTTKNSGLCMCTGSGSSSWNFTMNRISHDVVHQILHLTGQHNDNVDEIVRKYNRALRFAADDERIQYTIRDLIPTSVWPKMPNLMPKAFASKMFVKSYCRDGNLVIDGGVMYHVSSGTTVIVGTNQTNVLKTVKMFGEDLGDDTTC